MSRFNTVPNSRNLTVDFRYYVELVHWYVSQFFVGFIAYLGTIWAGLCVADLILQCFGIKEEAQWEFLEKKPIRSAILILASIGLVGGSAYYALKTDQQQIESRAFDRARSKQQRKVA
jgi:hypothetical protein